MLKTMRFTMLNRPWLAFHQSSIPSVKKSLVLLLEVKNRNDLMLSVSNIPPGTGHSFEHPIVIRRLDRLESARKSYLGIRANVDPGFGIHTNTSSTTSGLLSNNVLVT